jgi:hypothetical protein
MWAEDFIFLGILLANPAPRDKQHLLHTPVCRAGRGIGRVSQIMIHLTLNPSVAQAKGVLNHFYVYIGVIQMMQAINMLYYHIVAVNLQMSTLESVIQ